jgi:hypothetical protein
MPWCSKTVPKPENWDPIKQMHAIGENYADSLEAWIDRNPDIRPENKDKFLKIALERVGKLDFKPHVFEALWDGDTQGWFLMLFARRKTWTGYNRSCLWSLRGAGGDFRLFTGLVPPYPEAYILNYVGTELAKVYDVPFYFPSPQDADDDCPGWWEKDETKRCISCGKYLSIERKNVVCYHCDLKKDKK